MGKQRQISAFTEEDMELLRANPYTYEVSEHKITYTKEFKTVYWDDYTTKGMSPRKIFEKYGYSPNVVGTIRIDGFQQAIKREASLGQDFVDGNCPGKSKAYRKEEAKDPKDALIAELRQTVEYQQQEIEFLKKISMIGTSKS